MALNIKQVCSFSEEVKKAPVDNTGGYAILNLGKIVKLGYMCEESAMHLPIFLKVDNELRKFYIGKTRIFEVSDVEITEVRVPIGWKFVLDYICEE